MKIQIFLADQELQLSEQISFPLNKTFENLSNPTDIIVQHSKSINIPITSHNNKIFANAYRLDRAIVGSTSDNIGLYLDPTKRIPFRMTYNHSLLMEGYAKFVSASYSTQNKYYTINLFGMIGEIFQEMMNVVTNRSKLNGLDEKYLLDDSKIMITTPNLNKDYIKSDWNRDTHKVWPASESIEIYDMYGFAPSHRGLYNGFKSNKIQVSDSEIKEISDVLKEKWGDTDNLLGADELIGDGFPDYQMNQFRSNRMKPYVYFNHLMRLYSRKCKELTGYDLELDSNWFNNNNPYWAKICYMLDFLDLDAVETSDAAGLLIVDNTEEVDNEGSNTSTRVSSVIMEQMSSASNKSFGSSISIGTFDVGFGLEVTHSKAYRDNSLSKNILTIMPDTEVRFDITVNKIVDGNPTSVSSYKYWTNAKGDPNISSSDSYIANNFLPMIENTNRSSVSDRNVKKFYYVTIPNLEVEGDFSGGCQVDVVVSYYNTVGASTYNYNGPAIYEWNWQYSSNFLDHKDYIYSTTNDLEGAGDKDNVESKGNNSIWYAYIDNTKYLKDWREDIKVNISNLYQRDEPLFNVILQYTKMFGLIWDVDYGEKKVYIKTKHNMFNDIEYISWDDKIDRSREMIIEPITFDSRCVVFNYEDVDGYRYSSYRDKYGVNIGEKLLYTGYEFNTENKDLFSGIYPSSVSSKSYITYKRWYNWNTTDVMLPVQEQRVLPDYETDDESGALAINNWYLRGTRNGAASNLVTVTDDTALMTSTGEYCYIDPSYAQSIGMTNSVSLPTFSTAIKFKDNKIYGMFFNTPMVDYTYDKLLQQTTGNNIYELFWKDYLADKYNVQNKKVTAYFYLSNIDFEEFKFNKLVLLSNQLFLVNKIIDFDLNNNGSTKCELIQISDPKSLDSKIF